MDDANQNNGDAEQESEQHAEPTSVIGPTSCTADLDP